MSASRSDWRSIAAFVLLILIWAYNWIVMKVALQEAGPVTFSFLRTVVGLVSLFGVMLVLRKPLKPQAVWPSVGLGLLQTSAYTIAIVMALVSGGAGKTAVLVFTMPFWTLLLSRLFLDEPVHRRQWFAVLLAFSGLMLIIQPWQLQGSLLSQILAIAGGFLWAASSVFAKRLRAAHTVDSLSLTTWQMVFGIVPLALFAWWTPERATVWSPSFMWALFYSGALSTGLGWLLWMSLLNRLPANTASLNALAIPVVAVSCAALQLNEWPQPLELGGMVTVAAGLWLLSRVRG